MAFFLVLLFKTFNSCLVRVPGPGGWSLTRILATAFLETSRSSSMVLTVISDLYYISVPELSTKLLPGQNGDPAVDFFRIPVS